MLTDKYTSRRYDVQDTTNIDTEVLEHIPFDYPASASDVTYQTGEFTSVCPWTGLPDFARLAMTVEAWYNDRGGISAPVKAGYPAS